MFMLQTLLYCEEFPNSICILTHASVFYIANSTTIGVCYQTEYRSLLHT